MNTNEITHPAPDLTAAESAELLTPPEVIDARHVDRLNELLAEQRAFESLCTQHQNVLRSNSETNKACSMCAWLADNHEDRITLLEIQRDGLLSEKRDLAQLLGCEPGEVRQRVETLIRVIQEGIDHCDGWRKFQDNESAVPLLPLHFERKMRAAVAGWRKAASEPQVLRRPVHACGIEGKTVCGLAIENNHTESDPILQDPLHESVTCEACMARSRKAEEGS